VRPAGATAPLLTVAAFLTGPLALLAPLGLAPLLTVVAAGLAVIAGLQRRLPVPSADLAASLALLCALALASGLWAVDSGHSLARAGRLVGECVEGLLLVDAGARLTPPERRRVLTALALGLAVLVVLAVADWGVAGGLTRWMHGSRARVSANNRGATVLAITMWPALVWLWRARGRGLALAGWGVAAVGVAACASESAQLALAVASLGFLVAWRLGRAAAQTMVVLASAAVIAMPLLPFIVPPPMPLAPDRLLKPSAVHRLVIWRFADERIGERPLLGWGLDASRAIPGGEQRVVMPDGAGHLLQLQLMPLHPHNGALQVWLELGAVGALVGALLTMVATSRLAVPSLDPAVRAAGLAAFTAAAIELSLSYGMWQSWWIAALWLAAFAVQLTVADPTAER